MFAVTWRPFSINEYWEYSVHLIYLYEMLVIWIKRLFVYLLWPLLPLHIFFLSFSLSTSYISKKTDVTIYTWEELAVLRITVYITLNLKVTWPGKRLCNGMDNSSRKEKVALWVRWPVLKYSVSTVSSNLVGVHPFSAHCCEIISLQC